MSKIRKFFVDEYPEVLDLWDFDTNQIDPCTLICTSRKMVNWVCNREKCRNRWRSTVCKQTGRKKGCQKCRRSKGESLVRSYLEENEIEYDEEKRMPGMGRLRFDYWLKDMDPTIAIEFDGSQHFKPWKKSRKALKSYRLRQGYDKRKNQYCLDNNIVMYRIAYTDMGRVHSLLKKFLDDPPDRGIHYSDPVAYGAAPAPATGGA